MTQCTQTSFCFEIYDLVERTLRRQRYLALTKKDKGVVRRYLAKLSGRACRRSLV